MAGRPVRVQFTPHLLPANRGILATVYVKGEPKRCTARSPTPMPARPSSRCCPWASIPARGMCAAANFCHVGVVADRLPGRAVVIAALDNLTKGSSGQAIQNANLMLGLDETEGLMLAPVFP